MTRVMADTVDGIALAALLFGVGWWVGGSGEIGAALGVVGLVISRRTSEISQLQEEVRRLQARVFECEQGKASTAWVDGIRDDLERGERLLDRRVERLEDRAE